jgi:hypothetical protein
VQRYRLTGSTLPKPSVSFSNCLRYLFAFHQRVRRTTAIKSGGESNASQKGNAQHDRADDAQMVAAFPFPRHVPASVLEWVRATMDEIHFARITAIAFAVLWTALLGLHLLSGS